VKFFLVALLGAIVGVGVSIASFYAIGHFFGPLSQGEDDATKYFKVFLAVSFALCILGSLISIKYYKNSQQKKL
jgi:hypothetical protein